jgi:hypothetical protein
MNGNLISCAVLTSVLKIKPVSALIDGLGWFAASEIGLGYQLN